MFSINLSSSKNVLINIHFWNDKFPIPNNVKWTKGCYEKLWIRLYCPCIKKTLNLSVIHCKSCNHVLQISERTTYVKISPNRHLRSYLHIYKQCLSSIANVKVVWPNSIFPLKCSNVEQHLAISIKIRLKDQDQDQETFPKKTI